MGYEGKGLRLSTVPGMVVTIKHGMPKGGAMLPGISCHGRKGPNGVMQAGRQYNVAEVTRNGFGCFGSARAAATTTAPSSPRRFTNLHISQPQP
jgi:hypothetical protein